MTLFQISLMILLFLAISLCLFTTIYALYCETKQTANSQVMNFIIIAILIISIISIIFAIIELFI